jgi:hypothetical protein
LSVNLRLSDGGIFSVVEIVSPLSVGDPLPVEFDSSIDICAGAQEVVDFLEAEIPELQEDLQMLDLEENQQLSSK